MLYTIMCQSCGNLGDFNFKRYYAALLEARCSFCQALHIRDASGQITLTSNTEGGAHIVGNVTLNGGDFNGRDSHTTVIQQVGNPSQARGDYISAVVGAGASGVVVGTNNSQQIAGGNTNLSVLQFQYMTSIHIFQHSLLIWHDGTVVLDGKHTYQSQGRDLKVVRQNVQQITISVYISDGSEIHARSNGPIVYYASADAIKPIFSL